MVTTFVLLGLSVIAVWLPTGATLAPFGARPWRLVFIAAVAVGLLQGVLTWPAVLSLGALAGACAPLAARRASRPSWQAISTLLAVIVGLAMALHLLPGFHNPVVIRALTLTDGAPPFTQYANFDKAAAGLLFLAAYAHRITRWTEVPRVAAVSLACLLVTAVLTFGAGMSIDLVRIDPKLPEVAAIFLVVNLLFTCVAEEAFFRGFLQERLTQAIDDVRTRRWLPIVVSAGFFGAAHAAGGPAPAALATIAGLGYAAAYAATRRIEAPILVHFALNGTQFFLFSYPYLAR